MTNESLLTASLEEFGLSRYESRAYVTLITRGAMTASDLAFYSEIPRTKIYSTMKKLTGKNLAIMSNNKSAMTCEAIKPEDAFDEIIHEQIQKVTMMNTLVEDLKKASEENRRAGDTEEKRYTQIGTGSILNQMRNMIKEAKISITIISDRWGLGLLAECREQLWAAQKKNVTIRCIIPYEQVCTDIHRTIPGSIDVRATHIAGNYIIFDATDVLLLDNTNGSGSVFPSTTTFATVQMAVFEDMWQRSMKTQPLIDMTVLEAQEICKIIETVNATGLSYILNEIENKSNKKDKKYQNSDLYELLERDGIGLDKRPLYDAISMFDVIMQITCNGHVSLERNDKSITVQTPQNNNMNKLPWVAILQGYLHKRGYNTRVIHQTSSTSDINEKTHIQLGKK